MHLSFEVTLIFTPLYAIIQAKKGSIYFQLKKSHGILNYNQLFITLLVLSAIVALTLYSHNKNQNTRVDITLTDNNTTKMYYCPCQKKDK